MRAAANPVGKSAFFIVAVSRNRVECWAIPATKIGLHSVSVYSRLCWIFRRFLTDAKRLSGLEWGSQKKRKSIRQSAQLLPEASEYARFGEQNGIDRHAKLGGDGGGFNAVDGDTAKGLPGFRLELGLDEFHEAAGDVLVVLLVPEKAQAAGRVGELIEHAQHVAVAGGGGAAAPGAPQGAE